METEKSNVGLHGLGPAHAEPSFAITHSLPRLRYLQRNQVLEDTATESGSRLFRPCCWDLHVYPNSGSILPPPEPDKPQPCLVLFTVPKQPPPPSPKTHFQCALIKKKKKNHTIISDFILVLAGLFPWTNIWFSIQILPVYENLTKTRASVVCCIYYLQELSFWD